MATKIVLCAVLISAVLAHTPSTRGNIALGDTLGSHIIYHEIHEKYAMPFIVRDEYIEVKGINKEIIKAVLVSDLEGGGKSCITSGGIGRENVTITLESERGSGYKFLVQVYAVIANE